MTRNYEEHKTADDMVNILRSYYHAKIADGVPFRGYLFTNDSGRPVHSDTFTATAAGLLSHSQPSTTLDIYTHAFDKNKKAASEALQQGLDI